MCGFLGGLINMILAKSHFHMEYGLEVVPDGSPGVWFHPTCALAHPRSFCALGHSYHHSGCTVLGDALHKCCSAAWHGACVHRCNQKRLKKPTYSPTTKKKTPNQQKLYGQRWVKRNPRASGVWCVWMTFFFSAVAWVKRGTRVHKCDPLAQR